MTRSALALPGLAFLAAGAAILLTTALPAGAANAAIPLGPYGVPEPVLTGPGAAPQYIGPNMAKFLHSAGLAEITRSRQLAAGSRQQPGNTGSGPGPGQQLPRDLDITFVDNNGAPGNTNAPTKATLPPYTDWEPAYAPDRHTIVFSSNRPLTTGGASTGYHLWSMQNDGSYQQPVTGTVGTDQEWPAFSPDGNRVVYSSRDTNGVAQLHVLVNGGADTVITDGPGDKTHPTWSHGDVIAFQDNETTPTNPAGHWKLWLMSYVGGVRAQLTGLGTWDPTGGAADDTEPAWEPNGAHIAFTRTLPGATPRIWLISAPIFSPTAAIQASAAVVGALTDFVDPKTGQASSDKDPAWRPDGPEYLNNPDTNPNNDVLAFASTRKSDPTNVNQGAISVGTTYGIYEMPISYSDTSQIHFRTETVAEAQASLSHPRMVAEDTQHPPFRFDNIDPTWSPEQTINPVTGLNNIANRIGYASNSGIPYSNASQQYTSPLPIYDIWTSEIYDVTPPSPLALPTVTPRLTAPGQTVTIKAQFADLNSGIRHVYVEIKNPDSHLQDKSLPGLREYQAPLYAIDGHRIYVIETFPHNFTGTPTYIAGTGTEIGYQPIDPVTYTYSNGAIENLPFDVTRTGFTAGIGGVFGSSFLFNWPVDQKPDNFVLELKPSTDPNDPPGTYTAPWTTDPNRSCDYFIDLIAVDNAGNLQDYDNIWGFSTKQFGASNSTSHPILLVADYTSPQQFLLGRGSRLEGGIFGVEEGLTDNPIGKAGVPDIDGVFGATGNPPPSGNITGYANSLGLGSWVDWPNDFWFGPLDNRLVFLPKPEDSFPETLDYDGYDIWRILARGPLPPSVLANYGPLTVQEPSVTNVTKTVSKQVNYNCVVWSSPYTNDEYVGPGTIVDKATQDELQAFIQAGGHVFLTGQDVAWALTLGNPNSTTSATTWLANNFGVKFHADAFSPDGAVLTAQTGTATTPARIGGRWVALDSPIHLLSFSSPNSLTDEYLAFPGYWWYGVRDQEFPDTLNPVSGLGVTDYQQSATDQNVISTENKGKNIRTVYAGFGIEGVDQEARTITPPAPSGAKPPPLQITSENHQTILMHGIVCWLRDFRATGHVNVLEADGRLQPFPNVLVEAFQQGTNTPLSTSLSRADGGYTLDGLPTGTGEPYLDQQGGFQLITLYPTSAGYCIGCSLPNPTLRGEAGAATVLEASRPGYTSIHKDPLIYGHGSETVGGEVTNGQGETDIILAIAPPGIIKGTVTDAGTNKPIPGVTVTITNQPFSDITFTVTTDANGNYEVDNVPTTPPSSVTGTSASSYIVTFHKTGYQDYIAGDTPNANDKTPIFVQSQQATIVNAKMVAARATISGTVVDQSGNPVGSATVTATPQNLSSGVISTASASDGTFSFTNIAPDTYTLKATKGNLASPATQITLQPGQTLTGVTLVLAPAPPGVGIIAGTVSFQVGGTKTPESGVIIQLKDAAGNTQQATTDANGKYRFTGLNDGVYTVQPLTPGQNVPAKSVTLPDANGNRDIETIDFTLSPIYTFPSGLQMVSLPFDYSSTNITAAQALGVPVNASGAAPIASYDPFSNAYSIYPNLNVNVPGGNGTQTVPGHGYWVFESKATPFVAAGVPITSTTFSITLEPGWNLIGNPYIGAVAWNLVQVSVPFQVGNNAPGVLLSMQTAVTNHIINSPLYTYASNSGAYVTTNVMQPFVGYWIYVDPTASRGRTVSLTFTNPNPPASR